MGISFLRGISGTWHLSLANRANTTQNLKIAAKGSERLVDPFVGLGGYIYTKKSFATLLGAFTAKYRGVCDRGISNMLCNGVKKCENLWLRLWLFSLR